MIETHKPLLRLAEEILPLLPVTESEREWQIITHEADGPGCECWVTLKRTDGIGFKLNSAYDRVRVNIIPVWPVDAYGNAIQPSEFHKFTCDGTVHGLNQTLTRRFFPAYTPVFQERLGWVKAEAEYRARKAARTHRT